MNPYRDRNPGTVERPTPFLHRRLPLWMGALIILCVASGVRANTPALRVNGVQFGGQDGSKYATVYGVKGDGSTDDSSALNTALAAVSAGVLYLPSTTASYKIGTTTITIPTGVVLEGTARNGTVLVYTGTGCAVKFDSTDSAGIRNINIQVNSSSATARGICFANTSSDNKWNRIENVKVLQTNTPSVPVAGQIGIDFTYTGSSNAMYWNRLDQVELGGWDKGIRLLGSVGLANGPNANTFTDVMIYASQHGVSLEAYATENVFVSLFCSASGFAGTECVKIGDATNPTNFNMFYGLTSDQGVGPVTYTIAANAVGNQLYINSQSSSAGTDSGTRTLISDALTSALQASIIKSPSYLSTTATFLAAGGSETQANIGGTGGNLTSGMTFQLGGSAQYNWDWSNVAKIAMNNTPTIYPVTDATGNLGLTNFRYLTVNAKAIQGNGFYGLGSAPGTSASGVAAQLGTGPACAVSGNDSFGTITITTGTTPSAFVANTKYLACTITFNVGKNSAPKAVMIDEAGLTAAGIKTGTNGINFYSDNTTPNTSVQWFLHMASSGTPTLAASTAYVFYYTIGY